MSFTIDILLWYKQIYCSQKTVSGKNLLSLQIEWVYKEKRAYIIWQWPSTTVNQKSFPSTAEFWIVLNVFVYLNMMLVKRFMYFFLIDRVIIYKLFAIILLCKFIQAYIYAHKPIDFFVKVSIKFWWSKIKSYTPCLVGKKMFRIVHAVKNFVVSMHFSRLYATLSRWIK